MANMIELGEQPVGSTCLGDDSQAAPPSPSRSDKSVGNTCIGEASTNADNNFPNAEKSSSSSNRSPDNNDVDIKIKQNGTSCRTSDHGSERSSPCRSINSASNSSIAATSDEGAPRRSFSQNRYNSSPEPDSENEDSLERLMVTKPKKKVSVAVQTEYDENFPPLSALQSIVDDVDTMPMLFNIPDPQQIHMPASSIVSILPSSASSSDLPASCSTSPDGTLQLIVQKFAIMTDTVRGPSKYVHSVPWRIMVMPRQHVVQKKGTQKCLGFFLQCCPDAYSESWSCQASAELRLISQKTGVPNFTRKTNHVYTAKENDWGYSCFMTWADILDEAQGYIKNDRVILEVSVKADPPKNILSQKEFQKKIQEYIRLAEIQCQRGLIDKAIDCNLQALKFCKDKDITCRNELESQKAQLIEMKLKQSIERIEKGSDQPKGDDDGSNLSALRHAMGTNATRTSATKGAQAQKSKAKENDAQAAVKLNNTTTQKASDLTNANHKEGGAKVEKKKVQPPPAPSPVIDVSPQRTPSTPVVEPVAEGAGEALVGTGRSNSSASSSSSTSSSPTASSNDGASLEKGRAGDATDSKALVALGQFNKALLYVENLEFAKEKCCRADDVFSEHAAYDSEHSKPKRKKKKKRKNQEVSSPSTETLLENYLRARDLSRVAGKKRHITDLNDLIHHSSPGSAASTAETGCQTDFARFYQPKTAKSAHLIHLQQLKQQQLQQQHQQNLAILQQSGWPNSKQPPSVGMPTRQRKKATAKKTIHQQIQQHQLQHQFQQQQQQLLEQQQQQYSLILPKASPRGGAVDGIAAAMQNAPDALTAANAAAAAGSLPGHFQPPPLSGMVFGGDLKFGSTAPSQIDVNLAAFSADLDMKGKLQNEAAMLGQTAGVDVGPHYIEEWLRISAQTNTFNFNYDTSGKPFISPVTDGTAGGTSGAVDNNSLASDTSAVNILDSAMQQPGASLNDVNAALGFIGFDCSVKRLSLKMSQFLELMDTSGNLRDMHSCIERLALAIGENYSYPDDSVSVISVGAPRDQDRNYPLYDDLPQEVAGEFQFTDVALTNRLNSIIRRLASSVSLSDIVTRVENRLKYLESNNMDLQDSVMQVKQKETQHMKQITDLQKNLHLANEKNDKLNQQVKERKNEIKKLEKKLKGEAQLVAENVEQNEKMETLKKEIATLHRQLNEEQAKYRRDTQSLADSKKYLQTECTNRYSEVQKLTSVLEEKSQALKKSESQLGNERRNNSSMVSSLVERAKKAEINFLEHKLEDGLRILDRARDDCQMQLKTLEDQLKRHASEEEQDVIRKNIKEWENKKEEVTTLISQARNDFTSHINSIKNSGKQLSQLPKIQVPKPPPCPKLHPMPAPPPQPAQVQPPPPPAQQQSCNASPSAPSSTTTFHQQQQVAPVSAAMMVSSVGGANVSVNSSGNNGTVPPSPLPLERKAITPPSNRVRFGTTMPSSFASGCGPSTPQHFNTAALSSIGGGPPPVGYASSSSNATPVKGLGMAPPPSSLLHFQQQFHQQHQSHPGATLPSSGSSSITPIGVRPPNYQNGIMQHSKSIPSPASVAQSHISPYHHLLNTRQSPAFSTSTGGLLPGGSGMNHMQSQQSFLSQQLQQQQQAKSTASIGGSSMQSGGNVSTSNHNNSGSNGVFQTWGGGSVWGNDQLNNLQELLGHSRTFGPLGSEFGGLSSGRGGIGLSESGNNGAANNLNSSGNGGGGNNSMNDGSVFFP